MHIFQGIHENRKIAIIGVLLLAALLRFQGINHPYVEKLAWREADTASMADAFANGNWNIFLPQVRGAVRDRTISERSSKQSATSPL